MKTISRNHSGILTALMLTCVSFLIFGCGGDSTERTEGVVWRTDIEAALKEAKEQDKIVMIDFMATWCPPCRAMEDSTFCKPEVFNLSKAFIPVRIDVDKQKDVALKYGGNARKYGGIGIPNILFMTAGEEKLKHIVGYHGPENLVKVMDSVLAAAGKEDR